MRDRHILSDKYSEAVAEAQGLLEASSQGDDSGGVPQVCQSSLKPCWTLRCRKPCMGALVALLGLCVLCNAVLHCSVLKCTVLDCTVLAGRRVQSSRRVTSVSALLMFPLLQLGTSIADAQATVSLLRSLLSDSKQGKGLALGAAAARLAEVCGRMEALGAQWGALFAWHDGPLVAAMRAGDVLLLDEISLAEDSVLERLNSVLETKRTLVRHSPHSLLSPSFHSAQYPCRRQECLRPCGGFQPESS